MCYWSCVIDPVLFDHRFYNDCFCGSSRAAVWLKEFSHTTTKPFHCCELAEKLSSVMLVRRVNVRFSFTSSVAHRVHEQVWLLQSLCSTLKSPDSNLKEAWVELMHANRVIGLQHCCHFKPALFHKVAPVWLSETTSLVSLVHSESSCPHERLCEWNKDVWVCWWTFLFIYISSINQSRAHSGNTVSSLGVCAEASAHVEMCEVSADSFLENCLFFIFHGFK